MTKINIVPTNILKEDLAGYSKSLQSVMDEKMDWKPSLKFARIVRAVQPILKEFDEDRNTVLDSVDVKENDTQEVKRLKAKEANERLQLLLNEEVEVYQIKVSELMKIYDEVKPSLLIGFADALVFDVDPDKISIAEETEKKEAE